MTPLRCVIADDERLAREHLERLVAADSRLTVVASVGTGSDALDAARAHDADVVFLDIAMPGMSGIEVARSLPGSAHVIFTTAYDTHAVVAFELHAIDYLLKPFGRARFSAAIDRLVEPNALAERLAAASEPELRRLTVRTRRGLLPVSVQDVDWFEACDDYVQLHTASGDHLVHVRLRDLAERLPDGEFVRVHRSHVVRLSAIRLVEPREGGRADVLLTSGSRIPVSRSGMRRLRPLL